MSAFDQNYNKPFLRNEFSKIFEDFFMMTNSMAVKCPLVIYSNKKGLRQPKG